MIRETKPPHHRERLAEAVLSLCAAAGILEGDGVRELAAGVAHAAQEQALAPAGRQALSRLTARAFGSLGRPEEARRILVLGSGLVAPSRSLAATAGHPLWTLDLPRLLRLEGDRLELALYPGLTVILNAMAGLWDGPHGAGALLLRGGTEAGRRILGPAADRARLQAFRTDLRRFCEARLAHLGASRGWSDRPGVLFTDSFPAGGGGRHG